jgi:xanthine/uracil permease
MLNDALDRVRDTVQDADTNDWITAVGVGLIVLLIVLFIFRIIGIFFRSASLLLSLLIAAAVAVYVLDQHGIPHSIGGKTVDRWINDARDSIGV